MKRIDVTKQYEPTGEMRECIKAVWQELKAVGDVVGAFQMLLAGYVGSRDAYTEDEPEYKLYQRAINDILEIIKI